MATRNQLRSIGGSLLLQGGFESRSARLARLRDEVRSGTYQVDSESLALAILARQSDNLRRCFSPGELDERLAC